MLSRTYPVVCIAIYPIGSIIPFFILGDTTMKLREIRKKQNLSVPDLSRMSGVSVRTIEDLERRGDGRVSTLIRLADALHVTLDQLCRD